MQTEFRFVCSAPAWARIFLAVLLLAGAMLCAVSPAFGQGTETPAGVESVEPQAPTPDHPATEEEKQPPTAESEAERLAVNPITGMAVQSGANYVPLTGKERWKLYWKQNYFSVGAYFSPVMTSLVLDQASNTPQEWGGGFRGYGRRLASRTATNIIQGTVQGASAAILHEDVRYIASAERGTGRRILHALVYTVVTYSRNGRPTPNLALIGGYYASTAISTAWLPGQRSVGRYTLVNGSEQIGLGAAVNLLEEFWSELTGKIFKRR